MIIRRATSDDLRSLRVTTMRAFVDDPVMRWLYPEDEVFLTPDGAVYRSAFAAWVALGEVWCTDDAVGVAIWIPPDNPEVDFGLDPLAEPPTPELVERFEIIGTVMAEHTPDEPHWYLQVLATHPDWQRQGVGERLMTPTFERAEAEGLPCYLATETIENVAYYRGRGFEVRSEWDVPTGPHMWGMYRPA